MTRKLTKTSKAVKHHLPHRTRLKVSNQHRTAHTLTAVENSLRKVPGVKEVHVNHRTGSVLVEHDEREDILGDMGEAVNEVAGDIFEAVLETAGLEIPGLSIFAHLISKNFSKVDKLTSTTSTTTNGTPDIKMLVPVVLLGAAIVKLARRLDGGRKCRPGHCSFVHSKASSNSMNRPRAR